MFSNSKYWTVPVAVVIEGQFVFKSFATSSSDFS